MTGPVAAMLEDGRRLHLQHGPIDLVIEAFGAAAEVEAAYRQAMLRFEDVLEELVSELPRLRHRCGSPKTGFTGAIANRMAAATGPYAPLFITPMAAVAGAVADEILDALRRGRRLDKAYVNNGGDIAFHLADGARFDVGLVTDPRLALLAGSFGVDAQHPVRGVATSGRHGRSLSLGIADSVTVLAGTAADADAAATMIANAVVLPGSDKVVLCPASSIDPDSDLQDRMVCIDVHGLNSSEIGIALSRGQVYADRLIDAGRIFAAALVLNEHVRLASGARAAPALMPPLLHQPLSSLQGALHA